MNSLQGREARCQAAIAKLRSLQFVTCPVSWIWDGTGKNAHNGVSVPTPLRSVDLWVMHRAEVEGATQACRPSMRPIYVHALTPEHASWSNMNKPLTI